MMNPNNYFRLFRTPKIDISERSLPFEIFLFNLNNRSNVDIHPNLSKIINKT